MRLIDADCMKQIVTAVALAEKCDDRFISDMCGLIDSQPTAYDVDKVVERLEVNSTFVQTDDEDIIDDEAIVMLDDAVKIVESGGID